MLLGSTFMLIRNNIYIYLPMISNHVYIYRYYFSGGFHGTSTSMIQGFSLKHGRHGPGPCRSAEPGPWCPPKRPIRWMPRPVIDTWRRRERGKWWDLGWRMIFVGYIGFMIYHNMLNTTQEYITYIHMYIYIYNYIYNYIYIYEYINIHI